MIDRVRTELLRAPKIPIGFLNDLNRCTSRDDVFGAYARWCSHISHADRTTIAIADTDAGMLDLMAIDGNDVIATGSRIPIEGTLIGRVFATQTAEICPDLLASTDAESPKLASGGLKSCMDVPLTAGHRMFGAVAQAFAEPPPPSQDDLAILQAIANCLASHLLLHEQLEQLGELALTDPLTRTFNRRVFDDQVNRLWSDLMDTGTRFCLAQIDLDHFKAINDTHGHTFGDAVLKGVADALLATSRATDTVVRMGGEEFCVVLEDTTLDQAQDIAERMRAAIADLSWERDGEVIRVTASIGVAEATTGQDSPRLVAMLADEALYCAKKQGRDCVCQAAA